MKLLFSLSLALVSAAKDDCLANGEDPLNTGGSPNYGGTCWDKWGDAGQIQDWAEENCGGNNCKEGIPDDSCFDNPFHDVTVPPLSPEGYTEWLLSNDPGDLSTLKGCEDLLQNEGQWFDEELYGPGMTCDFNVQLTYPDDGSSMPSGGRTQTVKFFEKDEEANQCNEPPVGHPPNLGDPEGNYCDYCHIEESSKWIKISSNILETHPENPRSQTNRKRRDVDTMNEELGTEISDFETTNSNTYRVLKLTKNHANRNYWRMDCLYCRMFHRAAANKGSYYFEYVLETYNDYVMKLMYKTCELYYNQIILNEIQAEFDCFRAGLETDIDFCNGDQELCFENQNCNNHICYENGLTEPLPSSCPS